MSLLLEKGQAAKLSLEKKGVLHPPIMRVVACIDVSGSTQPMFRNGHVQSAVDQLLGAAMPLDDNGEIDIFVFHNKHYYVGTAGSGDFGTFVNMRMLPLHESGSWPFWGGTSYAGAIDAVEQQMFRPASKSKGIFGSLFHKKDDAVEDASKIPVLAFLITDGENDDKPQARRAFQSSSQFDIYWDLVGVGNPAHFGFLNEMADEFDNVGFVQVEGLNLTDKQMYDSLFTDEFVTWCKKFPPGPTSV